jgi:hypothetical protein
MPSKSGRQHRFFQMIAHDPDAADRTGVPQSVAREFIDADEAEGKHKHFSHRGEPEHPHKRLARMLVGKRR